MNKNPLSKHYWGLILLINCVCWAIGCSSDSEIIPTLQTESTPQIIPIEISNEAMIDPDLPSYLLTVLPWPGETLTLTEYNSLATNHSLVRTTTPSICLWIDPTIEPGDFFETYDDWLQQAELSIDGEVIPEYDELTAADTDGHAIFFDDSSGTPTRVAHAPAGVPFFVCYAAALEMGQHTVTFSYNSSSGKTINYLGEPTEYTWNFVITNDSK